MVASGYRLIMSPEAADDLATIHAYISKDSEANAARVSEGILDALETLKIFPHRAFLEHSNRKLRHAVRTLPVRPFVIYFRVIDDERVRVLSIQHGARRRPKRFR